VLLPSAANAADQDRGPRVAIALSFQRLDVVGVSANRHAGFTPERQ
jgi:hypothetical protein